MEKALVGISGGVDSSVSALLLKNQGYEVIGATLLLTDNEESNRKMIEDSKKVCEELKIKHILIDCKKEFQKEVIENFIYEYINGRTPNPCIKCNKDIKIKYLFQKAEELGIEYIATGHYAQKEYYETNNRYLLKMSNSEKKDQVYFLYNLTQQELKKIIFPLGGFKDKEEIREIAKQNGLGVASKSDSQDICFIPDGDYKNFLKNTYAIEYMKQGNIVDINGKILGKHNGIINYTVGQRKGLGLSMPNPVFVLKLDKEKNEVIVGEEENLYSNELIAKECNFIMINKLEDEMKVKVKTRYASKLTDAIILPYNDKKVKVIFDKPQKSIAKGQSVVFYKDKYVVGGGIIE
ncbi:MAG: tRNA 2-thiouridine(34) synthase MnmA [Clostridiales bacterium]|nr:tRNA 2-thiouridine(34) synthase MnmA [Clostridiales bacterium]